VGTGVSLAAAYSVFMVNFLLLGVFLTDFVVVFLALLGLPAEQTALARLAGTGVGAALALIGYVVWPTWAGSSANEKFAVLLEDQGQYAAALLRAYSRRPPAMLPICARCGSRAGERTATPMRRPSGSSTSRQSHR
jgi:uncharacterized membrane protein YccC